MKNSLVQFFCINVTTQFFFKYLLCHCKILISDNEKNDTPSKKKRLDVKSQKNLSEISRLYIYTNTPPHGYETQAPKVAETIIRDYDFNRKKDNKEIKIWGKDLERMQWKRSDRLFPFNEVHWNFIPSEARKMVKTILKMYINQINACAEKTIKNTLHKNADVLTKGKQTFCSFTNQSTVAARAYK